MPKNRFPDSTEKQELRRRTGRYLDRFRVHHGIQSGLRYCGMPSVEFLDVRAWRGNLRSVCAIELDDDVLSDMRLEWDRLGLGLPIRFVHANVLDHLVETEDCFDLYNLDFYGGFVFPKGSGESRCVELVRSIVNRQSRDHASFVLMATFNVRDKGARAYTTLIDDIPAALPGWKNVEENCTAHKKNQATRLKICFPFLCWSVGAPANFNVSFTPSIVYTSSATMVHFCAEFTYQDQQLPTPAVGRALSEILNAPMIRLEGFVPHAELRPPPVSD